MTEPGQEPPPTWVLRTPARWWEWWPGPLYLLLLGGAVAVGSALLSHSARVHVIGTITAGFIVAGAIVLGVASRSAYDAQEIGASWRFHVVAVIVGFAVGVVVVFSGLLVGLGGIASYGMVSLLIVPRQALGRPLRIDVVVRIVAAAVLGAAFVTSGVVGLVVDALPHWVEVASGTSWVLVPVSVVSIVLDARRLRTASLR